MEFAILANVVVALVGQVTCVTNCLVMSVVRLMVSVKMAPAFALKAGMEGIALYVCT